MPKSINSAAALLALLLAAAASSAHARGLLQAATTPEPLVGLRSEPGKVSLNINTDTITGAVNNAVSAFNEALRGAGSALSGIQIPRLPGGNLENMLNQSLSSSSSSSKNSSSHSSPSSVLPGGGHTVVGSSSGNMGYFNPLGLDETADNRNCISSPRAYIEAFLKPDNARRNLCVDDSLIFRLSGGPGFGDFAGADGNLTVTLNRFYDSLAIRPISFWSFKDGGEKYLRIGRPQVLGGNVDGNPPDTPNRAQYENTGFPGIRRISNGLALLEQIGFESAFIDITKPYMLYVAQRPRSVVPSFVPTWSNVVTFFSDYIARVANDRSFTISPRVAEVLDNTTFADLTGCPAQCTWADRLFPQSPLDADGRLESGDAISPAKIAVHAGTPESPGNCLAPRFVNESLVDLNGNDTTKRFRLVAPTSVAEDDPLCSSEWKLYFERFGENCTNTARFTEAGILDTARTFYNEFKALPAGDYQLQALVLRAYLATSCSGDFNPLFSGNGFTYTGSDGVVSPTVHELLLGQVQRAQVEGPPRVLGNYAYAFFCLDGGEECCLGGCGGVFPAAAGQP